MEQAGVAEYYALIIKNIIKDSIAFVHVCACMHVDMHVCVHVCACVHMCPCMWRPASRIKRSRGQGLSLSLDLADLVGWPGSCNELRAVTSPALGFQAKLRWLLCAESLGLCNRYFATFIS